MRIKALVMIYCVQSIKPVMVYARDRDPARRNLLTERERDRNMSTDE